MRINEDCMSCGQCVDYCKQGAISEKPSEGYSQYQIDQDLCVDCKECLEVDCPGDAIIDD